MNADEARQRALVARLSQTATKPSGGSNANRPEPMTVVGYSGFPDRMAQVVGDQVGSTPVDVPNLTPYPLSIGARVMVEMYEPRGAYISGIWSAPNVGLQADVTFPVPDATLTPVPLVAVFDSDEYLSLTVDGLVTIPSGRDGKYSLTFQVQGEALAYTRLFCEFVDNNGRIYRAPGATEPTALATAVIPMEAGSEMQFALFQDSGAPRDFECHATVLLIQDDLTGELNLLP